MRDLTNKAAATYARLLTRYPLMERAGDAKARLEALHRPVPQATPEAIAANKGEMESRSETGRFGKMMGAMRSRPDVAQSVKVGDPTLQDPKQTSAIDVMKDFNKVATGDAGSSNVTGGTTNIKPGENQPPPRSDQGTTATPSPSLDSLPVNPDEQPKQENAPQSVPSAAGTGVQGNAPAPAPTPTNDVQAAPAQVNDVQPASSSSSSSTATASDQKQADADKDKKEKQKQESSSKKKKKKGLGKLNPF